MRLGKRRIDRERLLGRGLRLGQRLDPVRAEQQVRVRQARVRERVLRVLADRLLEVLDRALVAVDRALVPVIPALQVELIRLGVLGVPARDALVAPRRSAAAATLSRISSAISSCTASRSAAGRSY